MRDIFEERFLRVRQLQKDYIVHYLNKPDTDFRLSLEFLKKCDAVSVDLETSNKQTVSYVQFACRSKCYVFNVFRLGKNEDFLDFLLEILQNSKVQKVVFDKVEFASKIVYLMGEQRRLSIHSLFGIKQKLFSSDPANCDLSTCCLRFFRKLTETCLNFEDKKPDTIFKTWVSNTKELGLDEIHYLSLNALATLKIYLRLKGNLLSQEACDSASFNAQQTPPTSQTFIVDSSCPEIVLDILELNRFKFEVIRVATYQGK